MSVFGASGGNNGLTASTNLTNPQSFTKLVWLQCGATLTSYQPILSTRNAGVTAYLEIFGGSGTNQVGLHTQSNIVQIGTAPTWTDWICFAMTGTTAGAGSLIGYWQDISGGGWNTASITGVNFTNANDNIGNSQNLVASMTMAYYMEWNVALTQAQLTEQFLSATPIISLGNLTRYQPMASGPTAGNDSSGNGFNMTVNGSLSTGASNPAFSQEYTTCLSLYSGSGYWLGDLASPPVSVGDVFITPFVVSPSGYTLQVNSDGTIEVFSGGDSSRQSFPYSRYDSSTGLTDGPVTIWINEVAPIWSAPVVLSNLPIGILMTPLNLASPIYASSPSGDTLVFSLSSGALPSGINLSSGGTLYGTPSESGSFNFSINATDYAGVSTASPNSQIIVTTQAVTQPQAIVQWENNSLIIVNWFSGSYILFNGVAPGTFGKYVGLTVTSTGSIYQLNALDMDYKLRSRWS